MNASLIVLLPSIFSMTVGVILFILIWNTYKKERIPDLKYIAFSFMAVSLPAIPYVIFEIFKAERYSSLRSGLGILAMIGGMSGLMIYWIKTHQLLGEQIKFRHYIMSAAVYYSFGIYSLTVTWHLNNGKWVPAFTSRINLLFTVAMNMWLVVEIIYNTRKVMRMSPRKSLISILLGWMIVIFAMFFIIIERVWISDETVYFLLISTLGFLLVAVGIYLDPLAVIPRNISSSYLLISDRNSGLPIIEYEFKKRKIKNDASLYSGILKAMLTILREFTEEDIPRAFSYMNLKIMIEYSEHFIMYYIAKIENESVRYFMRQILDRMELKVLDKMKNIMIINRNDEEELLNEISKLFKFAI